MNYFAQINSSNIVIQVTVLDNSIQDGINYLTNLFGGIWIQTNYGVPGSASPNYIYDSINNVFYSSQPYPSWILDKTIWQWQAPVPCPGGVTFPQAYIWDEPTLSWVLINAPINT